MSVEVELRTILWQMLVQKAFGSKSIDCDLNQSSEFEIN